MTEANNPGEEKAWQILASMSPEAVCRAADTSYNADTSSYTIKSLGMDVVVSVPQRSMTSASDGSKVLLQRLGYFFRLSILWYLVSVKDVACTGTPVKLENIPGGDIFTRGSHILPLDKVAQKYGRDKSGFIGKGKRLGGEIVTGGDASIRLLPLPRIPVVMTLWLEDEEFPPRVDLFFDTTCSMQMPVDMLWSVAMMSILIML
ncbi:MAG: DUF3786 domain-containing protein [Nitrospirota bacterium]|jgi:hypothetical protein